MTALETDEAVAGKLGPYGYGERDIITTPGWTGAFRPATDPVAALWALERYCKEHGLAAALRLSKDAEPLWSCTLGWGEAWNSFYCSKEEAICAAILGDG